MTNILALDTSTDACSVALAMDGVIAEDFAIIPREHTRRLLPMVDGILRQHQLDLRALDAIAFGRGPGSFTGLRICLGVVQGLAFGANLPVIPVSTLAAMAAGAFRRRQVAPRSQLLVALDARMDEIYGGVFCQNGDVRELTALRDEFVMAPGSVVEYLGDLRGELSGVGAGWHYPALRELAPVTVDLECHPHAYDIAALACKAFEQGEALDVMAAEPVYLRDKVSWKKRKKIRQA